MKTMVHFEKITGSAVTRLFEALIQHKIPLKLSLLDTDYESQTQVIKLTDRKKTPHLVMATPKDFAKTIANADGCQIHLEFTGIDRIKYAFTTNDGEIRDQQMYLKLPQELERKQRRELFRLDAPAGTRLFFLTGANRLELQVMNISIGGTLAALVQSITDNHENAPFAVDQMLEDVVLEFPAEILQRPVQIRAVQIKRIERNAETKSVEMGLEFRKISTGEQKRLTDLIYELQRQYLRHRLPLDL